MSFITQWADDARRAEYQQHSEDQKAINILESLLLGEQEPHDAANAISSIYEPLITASQTNELYVFWCILSAAARACGGVKEQADRLTGLILAIQRLPDVIGASGHPMKAPNGEFYWKDLPGWHIAFREYGIDIDQPGDFEDEWPWQEQAQFLLNATTFAATLLNRATFRTGMEFHACTALDGALRTPNEDIETQQYVELYLPAAATWILIAGRRLHNACMDSLDTGHVVKLNPERWNEWTRKFQSIAARSEISLGGREWARRAAAQMQSMSEDAYTLG